MTRGITLAFAIALALGLPLGLAACPAPRGPTLAGYFTSEPGLQAAGVKRIPIHTPKGDFTVWTKRFGNNPRI